MGWACRSTDTAQERLERQLSVSQSGFDQGRAHGQIVRADQTAEAGLDQFPGLVCHPRRHLQRDRLATCRAMACSVQWQREVAEPIPSILPAVGIDLGVAVFAALSDGTNVAPANHGKKALKALRKAQRNLSRKKRGSANDAAIRRVAKIQMRVANARKNFLHKQTTTIAKNHGTVVVEALKVRNMVRSAKGAAAEPGKKVRQKAGLNRAILDQGWGAFRIMLAYKLAACGGKLIEVPARLHQPDMRRVRRGGCGKPTRSSAVRLHGLRP